MNSTSSVIGIKKIKIKCSVSEIYEPAQIKVSVIQLMTSLQGTGDELHMNLDRHSASNLGFRIIWGFYKGLRII